MHITFISPKIKHVLLVEKTIVSWNNALQVVKVFFSELRAHYLILPLPLRKGVQKDFGPLAGESESQ